ncbi:MAG: crossover junction endodeoxyribonuclease RuvC [bacterium]
MRIIGIDPGYDRMGIAVIDNASGKETLLYSDCVTTSSKQTLPERLKIIGDGFEEVVKKYKPTTLAIEKIYFTVNQKTAIAVAGSKGVIQYLAAKHGLRVAEFTPSEMKLAVAGYGKATKDQIIKMTSLQIKVEKPPRHDDEWDAIAIGLTGLARAKNR